MGERGFPSHEHRPSCQAQLVSTSTLFRLAGPSRPADVDRGLKGWLGGILVRCTLLSTSHFANRTSPAWPPRSATTPTRFQLVNVSGCMQACLRGWKGRGGEKGRQTHERLACCEDGSWRWPSENTVHIMLCLKGRRKKKKSSPVEMK